MSALLSNQSSHDHLLPTWHLLSDPLLDLLLPLPDEELPPRMAGLVEEVEEVGSKDVTEEGGGTRKDQHHVELNVRREG